MKICFLLKEYPSVSQTFVSNQINELRNLGHEIDIYSYNKGKTKNKSNNNVFYLNDKNSYFNYIVSSLVCLLSLIINARVEILKECINLMAEKNFRALIDIFILYNNRTAFKNKKYDVALTHFGMNAYILEVGKRFGLIDVEIIGGIYHGYDMSVGHILKTYLPAYKRSFKGLDLIMPISELWMQKLISWGASSQKIHIVRMGINIDEFKFKPKKFEGNKKTKVLTVGRFVEKKGMEYLIKAISRIEDVELNIIGGGADYGKYQTLVNSLSLSGKIFFRGEMSSSEIYNYLNDSDVFCLPSVTAKDGDMEGIPVALMEAMASGTLVISTYHSGIPELITDKDTGLLCKEKNVDDIVEALKSITTLDLDLVRTNARRYVEECFDNKKITHSLADIICKSLTK